MASNISSGSWRVKISPIPASITVTQLAETINLSNSRITISKVEQNNTHYARINGFISEEEANKFAHQWSDASIFGETIKCILVVPNYDQASDILHSSCELLQPDIETIPNTQCSSATTNSIKNEDTEDKRRLCRFANKGTCRQRSNECKYRHQRCNNYESCSNLKCYLAHAKKQTVDESLSSSDSEEYQRNSRQFYSRRYTSDSESSTSSTHSMNRKSKSCDSGIKCFNVNCEFDHPDGWNPCKYGIICKNYYCIANHPFKRRAKCRDGNDCKISNCKFLHPNTRPEQCPSGTMCKKWNCQKLHPYSRVELCNDKENCTNLNCLFLHSSERPSICDQPDTCSNINCTLLHGSNRNLFEDKYSSKIHLPNRIINRHENTTTIPTVMTTISHNPPQFVALFCVFIFLFSFFNMYYFNLVSMFSLTIYFIFFSLVFFLL